MCSHREVHSTSSLLGGCLKRFSITLRVYCDLEFVGLFLCESHCSIFCIILGTCVTTDLCSLSVNQHRKEGQNPRLWSS